MHYKQQINASTFDKQGIRKSILFLQNWGKLWKTVLYIVYYRKRKLTTQKKYFISQIYKKIIRKSSLEKESRQGFLIALIPK